MQPITDPIVAASHPHKYLGIFGMLWVTFLIIAMFTAPKTFSIGSTVFTISILAYPLTYIFADIFTEVYGYRVTRRIVWTGFACVMIASIVTYLYSLIPPSASYPDNDAFRLIFKASPIIAIATVLAFFGGELTNSYVLAKMKVYMNGTRLWTRLIISTLAGQFVDNTTFFLFAFLAAGFYQVNELLPLVLSSVAFCTLWETLMLPVTYRVIAWIKKKEGLDTYDKGTNFNPFSLR